MTAHRRSMITTVLGIVLVVGAAYQAYRIVQLAIMLTQPQPSDMVPIIQKLIFRRALLAVVFVAGSVGMLASFRFNWAIATLAWVVGLLIGLTDVIAFLRDKEIPDVGTVAVILLDVLAIGWLLTHRSEFTRTKGISQQSPPEVPAEAGP